MKPIEWRGCYSGSYDLWVEEAYSHPAKQAPGLCFRILDYLEEIGLLREGDTILDPMAGIGSTGLVATVKGYQSVMVELEPYFKDLIGDCNCEGVTEQLFRRMIKGTSRTRKLSYDKTRVCPACQSSVDKRRAKGGPRTIFRSEAHYYDGNRGHLADKLRKPIDMTLIQGDSRNLSRLLEERGLVAVMSPPYEQADDRISKGKIQNGYVADCLTRTYEASHIGNTPGQIGKLKDKVVLMSPHYANPRTEAGDLGQDDYDKETGHAQGKGSYRGRYGQAEDNIGKLRDRVIALTSPPYEKAQSGGGICVNGYMKTPHSAKGDPVGSRTYSPETHGTSEGQIGQEKEESYLSAMAQVYAECYKVASVIAVVVKDPTRDGKIRQLGEDTKNLLQQVGFQLLDPIHAILFEEIEQQDMFAGPVKKVKGRLSFFKRLSWQKGSPVSNFEHVIIGVRPDRNGVCTLMSPPYTERHSYADAEREQALVDKLKASPNSRIGGRRIHTHENPDNLANIGNLRDRL